MKRLRQSLRREDRAAGRPWRRISFFACGEYGERSGRPHYHALIFGYGFPDRKHWKQTQVGPLFVSDALTKLWGLGHSTIGALTFESAAYCARYTLKKINGARAEKHYRVVDKSTGEVTYRHPEFVRMSRRPAIGKLWFEKYSGDCYPSDFLLTPSGKIKPPRYYDKEAERKGIDLAPVKAARKAAAEISDSNRVERRKARAEIRAWRMKSLRRDL